MLTVQQVVDFIDAIAPFDTQLDFDNCGLLLGNPASAVTGIHLALDCTDAVVSEAVAHGANLIITHHPIIFRARKHMREDDPAGRLLCRIIREQIAVIAAHTCLDRAPGGVNDVLARTIGLANIRGEDFLRVGNLSASMTADAYRLHLEKALNTTVRLMGDPAQTVTAVGLCSGSGGEYWHDASLLGADAFLSGEISHHHALDAAAAGLVCFECGHHATEAPGIFAVADALQNWQSIVQWSVPVTKSQAAAYARSL